MTDYKATPEQWDDVGAFASDTRACILELRARVELLELGAGIRDAVAEELGRNYPAKPDSSLVRRVALAISGIEYGLNRDEEAVNWASEARAAIREVAAWLREQQDGDLVAATVLEREAER